MSDHPRRLAALDWMRGLVIVLMAVDHASGAFNGGRLVADSAWGWRPGTELPVDQFLTRWITHLCAPTFVFLAGAAVALSLTRREARGEPTGRSDRYLLTRGLLLAALDPIWMSLVFTPGRVLLQVLYALGMGLVCMAPLRRLSDRWLVALALTLLGGCEALRALALELGFWDAVPARLLLTGGRFGPVIVGYPLLHWLPAMLLGWAFGRTLARGSEGAGRLLSWSGLVSLAVFLVVRGLNGYGNMGLMRDDGSLLQWLHVSKYPPSLTFHALELGIMALCLAGFLALQRRVASGVRLLDVLLVPGQTALLFYILHAHLLKAAAWAADARRAFGVESAYLGGAAVLALLFPLLLWYRGYKSRHPEGWTRYL